MVLAVAPELAMALDMALTDGTGVVAGSSTGVNAGGGFGIW